MDIRKDFVLDKAVDPLPDPCGINFRSSCEGYSTFEGNRRGCVLFAFLGLLERLKLYSHV